MCPGEADKAEQAEQPVTEQAVTEKENVQVFAAPRKTVTLSEEELFEKFREAAAAVLKEHTEA